MDKVFQYKRGMSNGFIIKGEKNIAVDSGCEESEAAFVTACEEAGIQPEDISLIIVTHGHVDHFYNLPAMIKLTHAPVMCHELAADFIMNGIDPDVQGRTKKGKAIIKEQEEKGNPTDHTPSANVDIRITDDTDLHPYGIDGRIIYTPGHSRGCMSIVLDSGEAIVGDMILATPPDDKPGLAFLSYGGSKTSPELYASIRRVLNCGCKTFYSGHGGPFSRELVEQLLLDDEKAYINGIL